MNPRPSKQIGLKGLIEHQRPAEKSDKGETKNICPIARAEALLIYWHTIQISSKNCAKGRDVPRTMGKYVQQCLRKTRTYKLTSDYVEAN